MECPKCNLQYNLQNRKPLFLQCGHSLCQECCKKLSRCEECQEEFNKQNLKTNIAILNIIKKKKDNPDKFIKMCFIGESAVGKTSLINRLRGEEFKKQTSVTIGLDFHYVDRQVCGLNIRFQLWDSAGQQKFRAISPMNYKNSHIAIIVYDVTQSKQKNNVSYWVHQTYEHCNQNVIKILVGNKTDMLNNMKTVPSNSLDPDTLNKVKQEQIGHHKISCKTYQGVQEFWSLIQEITEQMIEMKVQDETDLSRSSKSQPIRPIFNKKRSSGSQKSPTKIFTLKKQPEKKGLCPC